MPQPECYAFLKFVLPKCRCPGSRSTPEAMLLPKGHDGVQGPCCCWADDNLRGLCYYLVMVTSGLKLLLLACLSAWSGRIWSLC